MEQDPNALVGLRVRVLWKKGEKYDGVVTVFDENDGMHHVQYDDNEQK
jgi:putative aminopeptidase FrvX